MGAQRSRVSICNVLQTPSHVCPQPRSLRICQNPAVNLILMVQDLLLSVHFLPVFTFPPCGLRFPSCCHGGTLTPALYYLCQQRVHVPIRPSWQIQIVTGLMWTGSLHTPEPGSLLFKRHGWDFLLLPSFVFQFLSSG